MAMHDNNRRHNDDNRDNDQDRDHRGQNQGRHNNPGNFANDPERAAEAGRKGGQSSGRQNRDEDNER